DYASWQHTVSEHQARVQQYLGLRPFDLDESNALERFAFEESCRLEQTALLLARAQEFLKGRRVVFPAESALLRLVGEQKKLGHGCNLGLGTMADLIQGISYKQLRRVSDWQM